jgi:hypothetical protein
MARTRAPVCSLDDYHAEIRTFEDQDFQRRTADRAASDPGIFDGPAWYSPDNLARLRESDPDWSPWYLPENLAILREIDRRHGVCPDDPRVYSIRAYRDERTRIEAQWQQQVAGFRGGGEDVDHGPAEQRHLARLADCKARHFGLFPGASEESVDSIPKLWAWVELLWNVLSIEARPYPRLRGPSWHQRLLERVHAIYSVMHRLGVDWARRPPYPDFDERERIDEATYILRRLEREEADRLRPEEARHPSESNHTVPLAGQGGRVARVQLPIPVARAYQSYTWAVDQNPVLEGRTDRAAYDYIVEFGCPLYEDIEIHSFDTWSKYVRMGRRAHGKQKKQSRAGREAGRRSIVRRQELG